MRKWIIDILRDPLTGVPVEYNESTNTFVDVKNGTSYSVVNDIPVFLRKRENSVRSHIHDKTDTNFDYISHYEKDAEVFDYSAGQLSRSSICEEALLRKRILEKISKNDEMILDVGCGSAWLAEEMVKRNKKIVSLDISLINTRKALDRIPSEDHAAVVADVFNLPFGENTFDCVVASEIMEHLYDPLLFVQRLIRIVKPGGKLIVSTPYNEVIEYYLCIHCNKPTPKNAHLHSFDEKKMNDIFKGSGASDYTISIFNNKLLVKLRLHLLLSAISFGWWKFFDKIAENLYPKAYRIITVFSK